MHRVQKKSLEIHLFDWESPREKGVISLIYSDNIRETTTDLCYRHIDFAVCFLGFDKIIWICKDSISIFWFWLDQQDSTSRFRSIRCLCFTVEKMCLPCWLLENVGLWPPKNVSLWLLKIVGLSLTTASDWLLISSKAKKRQFLALPMNYDIWIALTTKHFRLISKSLQEIASQVVLKMNLDSLLSFPQPSPT